jgi:hypothetical protein
MGSSPAGLGSPEKFSGTLRVLQPGSPRAGGPAEHSGRAAPDWSGGLPPQDFYRHVISFWRSADTNPLSANQRAESAIASLAGRDV